MISTSTKTLLFLVACSCLTACQENTAVVAPAPAPTTTVLPTKQTEQVIIDKIDAAQQVNQQRLEAAEKF
ncbi:hypothetical protein [uncultured Thiothrix sp.]|uniref:hypothetical protein n=1 Tax=uncultured Thiothrix sp. TaxID=223185 RepID=UPI002627603F|nr:hypothetical protein [uncultured Thiothrix sp.]